jgi:cysteine-rich repeat protein
LENSETNSLDSLGPGKALGGASGERFILEELAGRGGGAVVFRALDSKLQRPVAVKICTAAPGFQRQMFVDRFEREVRLTSRVHHPHVLQVYDCGELEDGTPFVVLEWMPFGALDALVNQSRVDQAHIPLEWVHYYASAVAAGLRATHVAEIIHRDIKPANILIGRGGVAKVMDFGIAKDTSSEGPALTEMGQTLGTLGFMAPEQLAARPVPQSDIFSLGVTLYTLLTGQLPEQVMRDGIPTGVILGSAWELIPSYIKPLLIKMTAPNLSERFGDCMEILAALEQLHPGEDTRLHFPPEALPPLPSRAFVSGVTATMVTADLPGVHSGSQSAEQSMSPTRPMPGVAQSAEASSDTQGIGGTRIGPTKRPKQTKVPDRSGSRPSGLRTYVAGAILTVSVVGFGLFQLAAAPCGNGLRALAEACDDGNKDNTDACLSTCELATCGDGFTRADLEANEGSFEVCDDGNQIQHDTCTNQCVQNAVFLHGSGPDRPQWWLGSKTPAGQSELHRGFSEEYEMPATPVLLRPFWILRNEVTEGAYAVFLHETGRETPNNWTIEGDGDHPVGGVGRMNAKAYCSWLGGHLPLEVQWEYAARSGGEDIEYPWGNEPPSPELAILGDHRHSEGRSWPVCSKPAGNTKQGLCDMAGNVWEYVADGFSTYPGPPDDPNGKPYIDDPTLPSTEGLITLRGGGFWHTNEFWLRTRARYPYDAGPSRQHGFRCVWEGRSGPY